MGHVALVTPIPSRSQGKVGRKAPLAFSYRGNRRAIRQQHGGSPIPIAEHEFIGHRGSLDPDMGTPELGLQPQSAILENGRIPLAKSAAMPRARRSARDAEGGADVPRAMPRGGRG